MIQFYVNHCLRISFLSFHSKKQKNIATASLLFLWVLLSPASAKAVDRPIQKAALTFENVQILPSDIPDASGGIDVPGFTKVIGGQNFSFILPAHNYTGWFDDISGGSFGGLYVYESGTADATHFTLASPTGYSFDLNAFQYISDRGNVALTLTITYSNNTTSVQNYTLDGNGSVQTLSGLGSLANDIKSIEFVSDQLLYYNNLDVTDVKTITVLPVRLLDFTARKQGKSVVLQWQTAMEQSAKDFVVEHSVDGYAWQDLGTVSAHQNTSNAQVYAFTHSSPGAGVHYYRLLQRDLDGKANYSKIVMMEWNRPVLTFSVYPNPANNGILSIVLQKEGVVNMYDNSGVLVVQKRLAAGRHTLAVTHLAKGFYTIQVNGESIGVVLQ